MRAGGVARRPPLFSLLIRTKGVFRQKNQRTKDNFSVSSVQSELSVVASVQKEIIIIIIIIPEILFHTEYIAFSVFPFLCPFIPLLMISISKDFRIQGSIHKFILRTIRTPRTISISVVQKNRLFLCPFRIKPYLCQRKGKDRGVVPLRFHDCSTLSLCYEQIYQSVY